MELITAAVRVGLGIVFLVAGAIKLGDLEQSARAVLAYQLLSVPTSRLVGHTLPFVEIAVGVLLVIGVRIRPVATLGALLVVTYMVAVASVWARGLSIDCGCFSRGGAREGNQAGTYLRDLIRDGFLLGAAGFLWCRPHGRYSLDHLLHI